MIIISSYQYSLSSLSLYFRLFYYYLYSVGGWGHILLNVTFSRSFFNTFYWWLKCNFKFSHCLYFRKPTSVYVVTSISIQWNYFLVPWLELRELPRIGENENWTYIDMLASLMGIFPGFLSFRRVKRVPHGFSGLWQQSALLCVWMWEPRWQLWVAWLTFYFLLSSGTIALIYDERNWVCGVCKGLTASSSFCLGSESVWRY